MEMKHKTRVIGLCQN